MQRLKKSELVVKSPGLQIREKIQRDYGDLKTFSKRIGMSESSVDQYLTHKNLGSSTFKIRLTRELGKDFNALYVSDVDQVEELIARYWSELRDYDHLMELQMAQTLYKLGKVHNVSVDALAKALHGLALYKEACGEAEQALGFLHRALSLLRAHREVGSPEIRAVLMAELIRIEQTSAVKEKLYKDLETWSVDLKSLEDGDLKSVLCKMVGMAFLGRGELSTVQYYFTLASDFAVTEHCSGLAKLSMAMASEDSQNAKVNLETAERLLRDQPSAFPELLLARASLAKTVGDLKEAQKYIHMAVERCGRKLTAHSVEISRIWYQLNASTDTGTENHDRHLKTYVMKLVSELPKGYLHARGHLEETLKVFESSGVSSVCALEMLRDLAMQHAPGSLHPALRELYLKLLGVLAVMTFHGAHGVQEDAYMKAYEEAHEDENPEIVQTAL